MDPTLPSFSVLDAATQIESSQTLAFDSQIVVLHPPPPLGPQLPSVGISTTADAPVHSDDPAP